MEANYYWFFIVALIPLLLGSIYYNPKIGLGKAWIASTGLTEEQLRGGNMMMVFILAYIFSLFISGALFGLCVHQSGMVSLLLDDPGFGEDGSKATIYFEEFQALYGHKFRTFKHGVVHGLLAALMTALPILGINALFERKGWKYILIHTGYWMLCLAIMGGLLSRFV